MKLVTLFAVPVSMSFLAGCAPPSSSSDEAAPPEAQGSDLSTSTCDNTELFVAAGIADDLRKTADASFVSDGYYVKVPGSPRSTATAATW